jgi:hypothetical protein
MMAVITIAYAKHPEGGAAYGIAATRPASISPGEAFGFWPANGSAIDSLGNNLGKCLAMSGSPSIRPVI